MKGYFYNNGVTSTVNLHPYRADTAVDTYTTILNLYSSTNMGKFNVTANLPNSALAQVDNTAYSYFIGVTATPWSGANELFLGATVSYTTSEAE